jgi:hypothetical protein
MTSTSTQVDYRQQLQGRLFQSKVYNPQTPNGLHMKTVDPLYGDHFICPPLVFEDIVHPTHNADLHLVC